MTNGMPPPFPVPETCTRVPGRRPKWKVHAAFGQGVTAIMYNFRGGDLWQVVNGEWQLQYSVSRNDFLASDGRTAGYIVTPVGVCRTQQGKATLDIVSNHSDVIELLTYNEFRERFDYKDLIKPKEVARAL